MPRIPSRAVILLVTGLPAFLVSLNLLVMAVAFPALQTSFPHSSRADLSWVLNAHNIVFGALLIPGGRAADRWGRRRVFGVGLLVFTAGSLACGLAPTVPWLIAGRIVQGAGSALVAPASLGLLLAAFPVAQRATAVTIWGGIASLGAALGPTLGASIVVAAQWRWVFFVYVPIALTTAALSHLLLAELSEPESGRIPDWVGVVMLSVALAALALGIVEGRDWGWGDPRVLGSLLLAVVVLPLFVWRSATHRAPLLDLTLFRIRSFSFANLAVLIFSVGFFGQVLVGILFLTSIWHYGLFIAALAITPTPVTAALAAAPAGQLANRFGFRAVCAGGGLLYAAGAIWLHVAVTAHPNYLAVWLPSALLLGLGIGICFPVLSAASVSGLPSTRFAVGGAVNQAARQFGAVLGVAVAVAVIGSATSAQGLSSFTDWFLVSGLFAGASAAVSLLIGSRSQATRPLHAPALETAHP